MLWKSVLRSIRGSLGRYLAILAIIALGVGFFAGLRVTEPSILKTADAYIDELNLYDFRLVSTLGFTDEDVAAFAELDGVEAARGSVSADFIYVAEDGSEAVRHAHMLTEGVNGLDLVSGRLPESADECVLDAKYADESKLGTKIVLSDSNSQETLDTFACDTYTVVGLCDAVTYLNFERGSTSLGNGSVSSYIYLLPEGFSTEYYTEIFLTIPDIGEIYSDAYEDAVEEMRGPVEALLDERAELRYQKIYCDARAEIDDAQKELDEKKQELADGQAETDAAQAELDGKKQELAAMQAMLTGDPAMLESAQAEIDSAQKELDDARVEIADGQAEIDEAQKELDEARVELADIEPATVYTLDRGSNLGYASLSNDTAIVSGVAKVFPLFFFLVAALVCITTMTRMVSEQRTENGVLKALGYGSGTIAGQYLFYAGSASVIGCVIGFLLGSRYLPMALWQVYRIMYSIQRPIAFVLDWKLFALCTALYLLCALGATWLVCRRDLRESSAQLIRPKAPTPGKRIFLERIGFLWKHIKFLHKVSIRNILRYKKRMFMMIVGIGGCTALLLTGFGIRDTIQPVVDRQYNEIEYFDASVSFVDAADETVQEKFIEQTAGVAGDIAFLHTQNVDAATENGNKAINLVVFTGELTDFVSLHDGKTAIDFPEEGEAVVNYRFASENDLSVGDTVELVGDDYKALTVTVSAVFDNYIYDYIYVSADTCAAQWGQAPECNTAYVNFAEGQEANAVGAVLLGADHVSHVTLTADMRTRVGSMLESLDYIVLIVLVCAGALAFIVLYNLTNITITERTREIATLKVLGFYQREQNSYVFRENIVLTGISALCGIPMGIALLHYVMAQIKISTIYFGCRLAWESYLLAVLITFAFTFIVDLALTSKTRRINMAEAMKAIE